MEFDFVSDEFTRANLVDAHKAITELKLWDWLSTYTPDPTKGFMFSNDPKLLLIINTMKVSHSGGSFAHYMRDMAYIAKNGLDRYKQLIMTISSQTPDWELACNIVYHN